MDIDKQRSQRDQRRKDHECIRCGDKLPREDWGKYTTCITCRRKRRPITSASNKRCYNKAKKEGKCVVCKKREAIKGKTSCGFCEERREEYRETTASYYEGTGLCPCGNEREDKNRKYCRKCRKAGSKRSSKSWFRLKDEIKTDPLVRVG